MQDSKQYEQGIDGLFQKAKIEPLRDLPRELALYFASTPNCEDLSYKEFKDRHKHRSYYSIKRLHDIFYKNVLLLIRQAIAKAHQEKIPANCYNCLISKKSKCNFDNCNLFNISCKNINVYIRDYGVFPTHDWRSKGKDVDLLNKVEDFAFDLNNHDLQKTILILATILDKRKEN
jgi:hypothetical protein